MLGIMQQTDNWPQMGQFIQILLIPKAMWHSPTEQPIGARQECNYIGFSNLSFTPFIYFNSLLNVEIVYVASAHHR